MFNLKSTEEKEFILQGVGRFKFRTEDAQRPGGKKDFGIVNKCKEGWGGGWRMLREEGQIGLGRFYQDSVLILSPQINASLLPPIHRPLSKIFNPCQSRAGLSSTHCKYR